MTHRDSSAPSRIPPRPGARGGAAVFAACLVLFLASPVHQVTDSAFTLLVSQQLLENGNPDLAGFVDSSSEEAPRTLGKSRSLPAMLTRVGRRVYSRYPIGSAVLSAPFVGLAALAGVAPASPDRIYDRGREILLQRVLASLLMAALAGVLYRTARLSLSRRDSLALSLAAALGSQVWSTASRGLWSHTWGLLILAVCIDHLLDHEVRGQRLRPLLLGTLCGWLYLVRPTFGLAAVAVGFFLVVRIGRRAIPFFIALAVWLGTFSLCCLRLYHGPVPRYYRTDWVNFASFWESLAAHLFSPSRGLLVFAPWVACVGLAAAWPGARPRRPLLLWLTIAVIVIHIVLISGSPNWWAGHCYGPRLTTDLVPWFAVLGFLALEQSVNLPAKRPGGAGVMRGFVFLLACVGVAMNGWGAVSPATMEWNKRPTNIAFSPRRAWDWKRPQFGAGLWFDPAAESGAASPQDSTGADTTHSDPAD